MLLSVVEMPIVPPFLGPLSVDEMPFVLPFLGPLSSLSCQDADESHVIGATHRSAAEAKLNTKMTAARHIILWGRRRIMDYIAFPIKIFGGILMKGKGSDLFRRLLVVFIPCPSNMFCPVYKGAQNLSIAATILEI